MGNSALCKNCITSLTHYHSATASVCVIYYKIFPMTKGTNSTFITNIQVSVLSLNFDYSIRVIGQEQMSSFKDKFKVKLNGYATPDIYPIIFFFKFSFNIYSEINHPRTNLSSFGRNLGFHCLYMYRPQCRPQLSILGLQGTNRK